MMRYRERRDGNAISERSSQTMRKTTVLLACLICLPVLACKPHPGKIMRGADHAGRSEERGQHRGLRRACRDDLEKFCAADQTGRDRRACLQTHLNELSADCKTAVEARKGRGGRRNLDNNDSGDN
jgi:Cysteine rich repeat